MIYKQFGKTGKMVSAVGFGGMRFDTRVSNEQNARLLRYAFDKGINYFDTAPGYCKDTSEDIFGIAIREMSSFRDEFYVTSKCMPTAVKDSAAARAAVEKSLQRLNVDCIDFYHVWCIRTLEQYRMAMKPNGQYEALLRCKEEGLIGEIVVSTHLNGPDTKTILEEDAFSGVLLGVNILNFPYRWEGVQMAYERGYGVVAMNPLGGGLIPQNHQRFAFLAAEGETPTEAALRFCISCPQITVTLNGFTNRDHIDTACRVADRARPFADADIEAVKKNIGEQMNALCTGCGYCLGLCPANLPVANYMQFYNEVLLKEPDSDKATKMLENNRNWGLLVQVAASADACLECGECEQACTQHLGIIERLREISGWEKQLNK